MGCGNTRSASLASNPKLKERKLSVGPWREITKPTLKVQIAVQKNEEEKIVQDVVPEGKAINDIYVTPSQFILQKDESIYKNYSLREKLGEGKKPLILGSFGIVYKAIHKISQEKRAIKFIDRASVTSEQEAKLFQEIEILRQLVLLYM